MGCLVALLGALVGLLIGIGATFALLVGEGDDADALTWLVSFLFLGGLGAAIGITVALVWYAGWRRKRRLARPS